MAINAPSELSHSCCCQQGTVGQLDVSFFGLEGKPYQIDLFA